MNTFKITGTIIFIDKTGKSGAVVADQNGVEYFVNNKDMIDSNLGIGDTVKFEVPFYMLDEDSPEYSLWDKYSSTKVTQ